MATVETLRTISDIVDALTPLRAKERGEPVRSEDWNRVVDAVLSLARLGGQQERRADDQLASGFAAADHDHAGEADLTWFEPRTRELLTKGGTGPESAADIRGLETRLERALKLAEDYQLEVRRLQEELDGQRTRALARDRQLVTLTERIEAIRTVGDDVTDLRGQFSGLSQQLEQTLALTRTIDAEVVAGLGTRVSVLERLRDNLLTSDGSIGRYRDLEVRIEELSRGGVSDAELAAAVREQLRADAVWQDVVVTGHVGTLVDARTSPQLAAVTSSLVALDTELDGQRIRADQLAESVTVQVQRVTTVEGSQATIDTRLGEIDQRTVSLTSQVSRISSLETRVAGVESQVTTIDELSQRLGSADVRITALAGTVERVSSDANTRLGALERDGTALRDLSTRVDTITTALTTNTTAIAELTNRATEAEARLDDFGTRIPSLERDLALTTTWRSVVEAPLNRLFEGPSPQQVADRVSVLEGDVRTVRATQDATTQRLGTLEVSVAETRDATVRIETRLPMLEQTTTKLQTTVDALAARPTLDVAWQTDIEGRLLKTEGGIAGIAELERRTTSLEGSLRNLSTLSTRVDALSSDVTLLRTEVTGVNDRIAPLESRVAELGKTETRLSLLEQQNVNLSNQLRDNTTMIGSLGTRLNTTEATLARLRPGGRDVVIR